MKNVLASLVLLSSMAIPAAAQTAAKSVPAKESAPVEVAVSYSAQVVKVTNTDDLLALHGGSGQIIFPVFHGLGLAGELGGERTNHINSQVGLSLVTYTMGPRYVYPVHRRYRPFVQTLFGGVHAFDALFPHTGEATGAANAFAMVAGGGLDVNINRHLAVRAGQVDYVLTHLPNNGNNQQHNTRYSAGIVFRIPTR